MIYYGGVNKPREFLRIACKYNLIELIYSIVKLLLDYTIIGRDVLNDCISEASEGGYLNVIKFLMNKFEVDIKFICSL